MTGPIFSSCDFTWPAGATTTGTRATLQQFFTPVAIYFMRSFFQAIPRDLEEAAQVDGCTPFSAFVRVMLLPVEWAGQRTIKYVDPADADKPKTQRATIFLEQPVVR